MFSLPALTLSFAWLTLVVAVGAQPAPPAAPPQPWSGLTRTDLLREDLSAAGHAVIQVRVDFASGAAAPRHRHPGEEIVYVLSGSLEYRLDGRPPVTVGPGEVLFIPDGTVHAVRNVGSENASELATYVVRNGESLLIPAE